MDATNIIIIAIICLFILLCLTVLFLVIYSGLLHDIKIEHGRPPVQNLTFMYQVGKGPYKNSTDIFSEVAAIAPRNKTIGVYYDDPVQETSLRWLAGSLLDEPDDTEIEQLFIENGYKKLSIGPIKNCVWTSFPFTFTFSIPIAIYRVYPTLVAYLKEKNVEAHPIIEIYDANVIHFLAITEQRDVFYIPEIKNPIKDKSQETSILQNLDQISEEKTPETSIIQNLDQISKKKTPDTTILQSLDQIAKENNSDTSILQNLDQKSLLNTEKDNHSILKESPSQFEAINDDLERLMEGFLVVEESDHWEEGYSHRENIKEMDNVINDIAVEDVDLTKTVDLSQLDQVDEDIARHDYENVDELVRETKKDI